jgi:hypothetical protein
MLAGQNTGQLTISKDNRMTVWRTFWQTGIEKASAIWVRPNNILANQLLMFCPVRHFDQCAVLYSNIYSLFISWRQIKPGRVRVMTKLVM